MMKLVLSVLFVICLCQSITAKHTHKKDLPSRIQLGTIKRVWPQYDLPEYWNDEDHPERIYGSYERTHDTIFLDGSREGKENYYTRDITGMTLPRQGREQYETESDRGATSPIRVYKVNGERLLPPKEGLPFEQPDWEGKRQAKKTSKRFRMHQIHKRH